MTSLDRDIDMLVRDALLAEGNDLSVDHALLDRVRHRLDDADATRTRRGRLPWVAAAAVILVITATGAVALLGGSDDAAVTAGMGDTPTVLEVPAVGDAAPQILADGTPVWVVHHEDGEISVVDASSAHRPFGARSLIGWCAPSRRFQEGQHGSVYDERGHKQGGPAPRNLDTYKVTPIDGGSAIEVGQLTAGAPRGDAAEGPPVVAPEPGPNCLDDDGSFVPGYNPGSTELHQFDVDDALPASEAPDSSNENLLLFQSATLLLRQDTPTVACSPTLPLPACDGPVAPDLQLPPQRQGTATLTGPFLARVDDGRLFDVTFVAGYLYEFSPE